MAEAAYLIVRFAQRLETMESMDQRDLAGQCALMAKNANDYKVALYVS
jgi:hypothetical protein